MRDDFGRHPLRPFDFLRMEWPAVRRFAPTNSNDRADGRISEIAPPNDERSTRADLLHHPAL
jgi:hypothetical protein